MNIIIYDEESMIKFVKSIRPYPILYDTRHPNHHSRTEQNVYWEKVANEMGDDITLCRDKWKNVKASYTRYLRRIHNGDNSSKPYYLAQYLDYLTPFITFGSKVQSKSTRCDNIQGPSTSTGINLDYHTDNYVKARIESTHVKDTSNEIVVNVGKKSFKRKLSEQDSVNDMMKLKREQEIKNEGNLNFLKSTLPEVSRMSEKEKLKFKLKVLNLIASIRGVYTN